MSVMTVVRIKLVFLDRDGTLNVDRGYVGRREEWEWLPGVVEGLKRLRDAGFRLAVVTNQSGVAAGRYGVQDVDALHEYMRGELAAQGVELDAVAYCPHAPDAACDCRKPRTGLARQVERSLTSGSASQTRTNAVRVDYAASWTIGDKPGDAAFGLALGTRTALIRSRYWNAADLAVRPTLIADSLPAAADEIVRCRE